MLYNENGDDMKRRRLKKWAIALLVGVIVFVIAISLIIAHFIKINSVSYKLGKIGYHTEEITKITKILTKDEINNDVLKMGYDENLDDIVSEKYFIYSNLKRYLDYRKLNNVSATAVVTMVNANRDKDYYSNMQATDTTKDILMLVNKYYYLDEKYVPSDLVDIATKYAYAGNQIRSIAYDDLKSMFNDAKTAGYTLIVNSGYRSYDWQKTVYNSRKVAYGLSYADKYVARPGNSEHQSGLAIDLAQYGSKDDFKTSDAYKWLTDNSYKYGFIQRYNDSQEEVTGFSAEEWHFRYVGKDAAKVIHEAGLSFDEYYAYYVLNKGN